MIKHSWFPYLLGCLTGALLTVLAIAVYGQAQGAIGYSSLPDQLPQDDLSEVIQQVRHWKGSIDAPITVIEFADDYCPHCQEFNAGEAAKWLNTQVDQGQVHFGYVPLPILGDRSKQAAYAGECAADQDRFWPFHDALLTAIPQAGADGDALSMAASAAGLDTDKFSLCTEQGIYRSDIQAGIAVAARLGVSSTPSFLIGGRLLSGNQPLQTFKIFVDAAQK